MKLLGLNSRNSYIKGLSTGYVYIILSILISFFMIPFSLQYLTKEEFGIFTIANELLMWLGLLELGSVSVLRSRASHKLGGDNTINFDKLVSSAFFIQFIAALLILFIGIILSYKLGNFIDFNDNVENFELVFQLMILGLSLTISTNVFSSLLIASKQIHIDNYLKIGLLLLKTSVTIVLLMLGFKLISLAIANLLSVVIINIIAYYRVKKHFKDLKINYKMISFIEIKGLVGKGWWFTLGGLAGIMINYLDALLIGKFVSLAMVTNFIITKKLFDTANRFFMQIFNVTRPYIGQFYGASKKDELLKLTTISKKISVFGSIIITLFIILINEKFISVWVGDEFYLGSEITLLLGLNFILQSIIIPNRVFLSSALYEVKKVNLIRIYEGILNLSLSIILVINLGIYGIIIASIISSFIFSSYALEKIQNTYFCNKINYNYFIIIIIITIIVGLVEYYSFYKFYVICFLLTIISIYILLDKEIKFYIFKKLKKH